MFFKTVIFLSDSRGDDDSSSVASSSHSQRQAHESASGSQIIRSTLQILIPDLAPDVRTSSLAASWQPTEAPDAAKAFAVSQTSSNVQTAPMPLGEM